MSANELYELTDLIFTQQSISVNQQTTKSTDRIFVPKIGTLVRNPIYNDILIAAGNNPEITQDEMKQNIGSLQQIFDKAIELNRKNNLLMRSL